MAAGKKRENKRGKAPDQRPWTWTEQRELAAALLAEDELSDEEIASKVNISWQHLYVWKRRPEFMERVTELARQLVSPTLRRAIAKRARRVRAQDERWRKLLQVIEERAADPKVQNAPGGKTGLLVRTLKALGSGPAMQIVEEYEFDAALARELRELEKHAATELGHRTGPVDGEARRDRHARRHPVA
jgi:hypothetical protein